MPCDPGRGLAQQSLAIHTAFPGKYQLCALQRVIEPGELGDEFYPRAKLGLEKGLDHKPQPAGGTCAGDQGCITPGLGFAGGCKMRQTGVEEFNICRRCAFLWAEDGGSAAFTT